MKASNESLRAFDRIPPGPGFLYERDLLRRPHPRSSPRTRDPVFAPLKGGAIWQRLDPASAGMNGECPAFAGRLSRQPSLRQINGVGPFVQLDIGAPGIGNERNPDAGVILRVGP